MSGKAPKGIVSPWKTERDDETIDPTDTVRFPGRMRAVYVHPLHGKADLNQRGLIALGKGLLDLLSKVPEARACFERQSVGFVKPAAVHITLDLGGVPFYAVTSTAEPQTARRMAIDRVAFALTEAMSRFPKAKTVLAQHRIEVANS